MNKYVRGPENGRCLRYPAPAGDDPFHPCQWRTLSCFRRFLNARLEHARALALEFLPRWFYLKHPTVKRTVYPDGSSQLSLRVPLENAEALLRRSRSARPSYPIDVHQPFPIHVAVFDTADGSSNVDRGRSWYRVHVDSPGPGRPPVGPIGRPDGCRDSRAPSTGRSASLGWRSPSPRWHRPTRRGLLRPDAGAVRRRP